MAPEVLLRQPHNFIVDYYALGVLLFEIVYGEVKNNFLYIIIYIK